MTSALLPDYALSLPFKPCQSMHFNNASEFRFMSCLIESLISIYEFRGETFSDSFFDS